MKKKNSHVRFSVRFNLDKTKDAESWEKLSNIKSGRKSEYCIDAILSMHHEKHKYHSRINNIQKINRTMEKIIFLTSKKEVRRKQKRSKSNNQ